MTPTEAIDKLTKQADAMRNAFYDDPRNAGHDAEKEPDIRLLRNAVKVIH